MIKKQFVHTVVASLCLCAVLFSNMAAPLEYAVVSDSEENSAIVYSERTEWRYRFNNNVLEKRLWSITEERWLTDWMPV